MSLVSAVTTSLAAAVLLATSANGAAKPEFLVAKLENGITVGFALVRSGSDQPGGGLGEVIYPRSSGLSRVLLDEAEGTYFGYRLEVSQADKRLKATIQPLKADVARELRDRRSCPDCKPPKLLAAALLRVPAPLTLADGEVLTIELLANATTGEKIIDVVKLATKPFEAEAMRSPAERILEATRATQRAATFAARGSYNEAIKEYRRALELNPNDASVRNLLGICHQQLGQSGRAEEQYRQALRISPKFAQAWNNLGSVAHSVGDYKQAIKHYEKAVELQPNSATAYRNMGAAYFALGQIERGLASWETAYRIDPSILEGSAGSSVTAGGLGAGEQHFYFAKICAMQGQIEAACAQLTQARTAGFRDWKKVGKDPSFEAVVRHPCYLELTGAGKKQ